MIECIFTLDYEIYGNGKGSLRELVYEPAEKLKAIFNKYDARFVTFVEAAELEMIEAFDTDPAIDLVKKQVQDFHAEGFELGLHLHPQWYNAQYINGEWRLDFSEYNLCTLSRERIAHTIDRSIIYLQKLLQFTNFVPLSFRAGNWLLQPTKDVAKALSDVGIKIDSSVFKGGRQHEHKLDYRLALRNGYFWAFTENVNTPELEGILIEMPTYTKMVPIWKMFTAKRMGLQQKSPLKTQTLKEQVFRILDLLRFRYPLKFDFCRLTLKELIHLVDIEIQRDKNNPTEFRPIIAIGHTKDLLDFETVESLLFYLRNKGISISTFFNIYDRCKT